MKHKRPPRWPLACLVLAAACGERAAGSAPPAARDSAGIEVVENPADADRLPAWTAAAEPSIDIGLADGAPEYQLHMVMAATRLADGRIVIANGGTQEIRFYGTDGRHLRTVGRAGRGPGEFQQVTWIGPLAGDSLGAWDAALARMSVLDREGAFTRSFAPPRLPGVLPQVEGAFADGSFVLTPGIDPAAAYRGGEAPWRDTTLYLRIGPSGEVLDTLGRFPGSERYAAAPPGGRGTFLVESLPFGKRTVTAVHGDRFLAGSGDRYEIAVHDGRGRLVRLARKAHEPLEVTPADREAFLAAAAGAADARTGEQERRMLAGTPWPRAMPAYTGLRVDPEGNVWVEEAQAAAEQARGSRWTVLDPSGRVTATVRTPPGLAVHQVGRDWVLGTYLDEDRVEHVRLHRITKPAGAQP